MQKRRHSMLEALVGTAIGFIVSLVVWEIVVKPVWNIHTDFAENLQITLLFTVVSIARSYCVRRFFNLHNTKNRKQYAHLDRNHGPCP